MASNNGGCSGCFGRTGLVLCGKPDKMVAANPVVHSVLSDQVLPCIPSSAVPGIVKVNKVLILGVLSTKTLCGRHSDGG